jgi:hypothetical protein
MADRHNFLPSISCYRGTLVPSMRKPRIQERFVVERVQTGVRMEKRLLKVLKAFAEFHDLTLGDLLEGVVLHAFDGKTPFSEDSRRQIKELKKFYGLDLDSRASHRLREAKSPKRSTNRVTNSNSGAVPSGHQAGIRDRKHRSRAAKAPKPRAPR